jgi:O-antigen ligase
MPVMGVVMVPVLFWGVMVAGTPVQRYRRLIALLIAGTLLYMTLSRASILAAVVAIGVLCFCLRRQRLLLQGAILAALFLSAAAVLNPGHFENFVSSVTSEVLYKGKAESGVLGSRLSPWQETTKVIKERPLVRYGIWHQLHGRERPTRSLDPSFQRSASHRAGG